MSLITKLILPIILNIIFTVALLYAGQLSKKPTIVVSQNNYVNVQFNYQILLLFIAGVSILTTFLLNKQNFAHYFSFGQVSAIGEELKLFGIKKGDTWRKTGISLCVVISLFTALFLFFQLKHSNPNWSNLQTGIFWILLFSLTNSFGEEMIYRLGVVSPLKGILAPTILFFISGILFGLPHYAGLPNGIIGVLMASVLGFILAKSMYETNGFFWAWTIHFIQDILIIGALYLIKNNFSH